MSQYAIDKDLRLLRHFSPPLQRAILPMASWFLRVAPTGFDRSKIYVQPFNVNGVRCHLLSPLGSNGQLLPGLFYIHGGGFVFRAMQPLRRMLCVSERRSCKKHLNNRILMI